MWTTHEEVRAISRILEGLVTLAPSANKLLIKLLNIPHEMATIWLRGVLSNALLSHQCELEVIKAVRTRDQDHWLQLKQLTHSSQSSLASPMRTKSKRCHSSPYALSLLMQTRWSIREALDLRPPRTLNLKLNSRNQALICSIVESDRRPKIAAASMLVFRLIQNRKSSEKLEITIISATLRQFRLSVIAK